MKLQAYTNPVRSFLGQFQYVALDVATYVEQVGLKVRDLKY